MKRYLRALPPFLGGKRAIAHDIMREVAEGGVEANGSTLLDPFMGGGAISIAAKALGYRVQANDLSPISEAVGKALIENSADRLGRAEQADALTHATDKIELPDKRELSLPENCREVLAGLVAAERERDEGRTRWLLRAWIAKLAISLATWGVPTMAAGRREWDELTPGQATQLKRSGRPRLLARTVIASINEGVFSNGEANTVDREDAITWLTDREGDVAYIDPPYPGVLAYEDVYSGVNKLIEEGWDEPTSEFSAADGWKLLADVLDAADGAGLWVVSMGTGGDPDQIAEMMSERGREPTWHPLQHKHLAALKTDHAPEGDELLIVGKR